MTSRVVRLRSVIDSIQASTRRKAAVSCMLFCSMCLIGAAILVWLSYSAQDMFMAKPIIAAKRTPIVVLHTSVAPTVSPTSVARPPKPKPVVKPANQPPRLVPLLPPTTASIDSGSVTQRPVHLTQSALAILSNVSPAKTAIKDPPGPGIKTAQPSLASSPKPSIAISSSPTRAQYCKPPSGNVPALWFPPSLTNPTLSGWYNLTTITSKVPSRRNSQGAPHARRKRLYDIEYEFGLHMDELYNMSRFREKSGKFALASQPFNRSDFDQSFFDGYFDLDIGDGVQLAVFHNVLVNNFGVIQDPINCSRHVQLGGCITTHSKVFKFESEPEEHPLVIELGSGASGTWHFPMELLVALRNVPPELLSSAAIHVPVANRYATEWLQLIPGVNMSLLTDSPVILAKTLLVPEMGYCGFPAPTQLDWLAHTVSPLDATAGKPANETRNIILVHRSRSRKIGNPQVVQQIVREFATNNSYNLIIHDDRHLPSLQQQIEQFASSDIVVMPHGAAGLFTNFSPERACILEFLPASGWNLCYARIAWIRNLNYIGRMMVDGGASIDIDQLRSGLERCVASLK